MTELIVERETDQGTWHAWNNMSPEVEWCEFVGYLVDTIQPKFVLETGIGQGFVTRYGAPALPEGSRWLAYESSDHWRYAPREIPESVEVSEYASPRDDDYAEADLTILDSDLQWRFGELERWHKHAKLGAYLLIHDTPAEGRVDNIHHQLYSKIKGLGIEGTVLPNPRGSFLGVKTENVEPVRNGKAAVCVTFGSEVHGAFASCVSMLHQQYNGLLEPPIFNMAGSRLVSGRNKTAQRFLEERSAEWFVGFDGDMTFSTDLLEKLLSVADADERPIVGGLAFTRSEGMILPTMYRINSKLAEGFFDRVLDYEAGSIIEVDATGMAAIVIHRSVLEAFREEYPRPFVWFQETQIGKDLELGEDITFCLRARNLGYPILVHTGAVTGHIKSDMLTATHFRAQRKALKQQKEETE